MCLINSALVGKRNLTLLKIHGKTIRNKSAGLTFKVEERLEQYTFTRKKEVPKSPKPWEVSTRPHGLTYKKKAFFKYYYTEF
jgi:hypothetical protein